MSRTSVALAALLTSTVVGLPATASAETWVGRDPAGDVEGYHYDKDPEPCGTMTAVDRGKDTDTDIRRVTASYDHTGLRVVARFRDLRATRDPILDVYVVSPDRTRDCTVSVWRDEDGKRNIEIYVVRLPTTDETSPPPAADDCGGVDLASFSTGRGATARVDPHRDRIVLELEPRALRSARWVLVGVQSTGFDDRNGTWVGMTDEWGTRPHGSDLPALSPRLRPREGKVS